MPIKTKEGSRIHRVEWRDNKNRQTNAMEIVKLPESNGVTFVKPDKE